MAQRLVDNICIPSPPSNQGNACPERSYGSQYNGSESSLGTVHRTYKRNPSLRPVDSCGSLISGPLRVINANLPPSRAASSSSRSVEGDSLVFSRRASKQMLREPSSSSNIPPSSGTREFSVWLLEARRRKDMDADLSSYGSNSMKNGEQKRDIASEHGVSAEATRSNDSASTGMTAYSEPNPEPNKLSIAVTDTKTFEEQPFKKWMSTLRHKKSKRGRSLKPRQERWSLDDADQSDSAQAPSLQRKVANGHRKTSSWSSTGLVEAVKSVTISLRTLSVVPSTRKCCQPFLRTSDRSSRVSQSANRNSMDSTQGSAQLIDEAAWLRAIKRRKTLEELISSEESYIADLKVLVNVKIPNENLWNLNLADVGVFRYTLR